MMLLQAPPSGLRSEKGQALPWGGQLRLHTEVAPFALFFMLEIVLNLRIFYLGPKMDQDSREGQEAKLQVHKREPTSASNNNYKTIKMADIYGAFPGAWVLFRVPFCPSFILMTIL